MENIENDLQRDLYIDCLTKQLEEINLLSSIFCNPGELCIHDVSIISDFNEYIDGKLNVLRSKLDFSLFMQNPLMNNDKIELRIELPHLYPTIENAIIIIRSSSFSKNQENYINKKTNEFINNIDKCDAYIYQIYSWLHDKLEEFLKSSEKSALSTTTSSSSSSSSTNQETFERLWILSHHIKSKTKRQEILRQAKDLQLTGFCRPGKPGIICVEGLQNNTKEFWRKIKSMRWQKITIKKIETKQKSINVTTTSSSNSSITFDINRYRKFKQFKEELFTNIGSDENIEEKMDMSLFMKFLELHNCGYMKKELFGFE